MKTVGVEDSPADARIYLKAVLGDYYDAAKIDAFIGHAASMLSYLESQASVLFSATVIPDYAPGAPGWRTGRCLLPVETHAGQLGEYFKKLRPPIPELGLFHSMQVSSFDAYRLQHWKDSHDNRAFAVKRLGSYFVDCLRGKRGQHLANGNALVARLMKAAIDRGVTLSENARAVHLVTQGARVAGVRPGDTLLTLGTGGVSIFALQLAVAAGARVIVTSSSEVKLDQAKRLGAWAGINYQSTPDWGTAVRRLTGSGVDKVIETAGAATLPQSIAATRRGGSILLKN
jgi:hypothetical protein